MRRTAVFLVTAALGAGLLAGCASDDQSDRRDPDPVGSRAAPSPLESAHDAVRLAAQAEARASRAREAAARGAEARAAAREDAARQAERDAERALADLESRRAPAVATPPVGHSPPEDRGVTLPDSELPEYDYALPEYDYELPAYDYELPEYDYELPAYDYELPAYGGGSTYAGAPGGLNEAGYPKNQYVSPYTRADGTHVDGYWRNSPHDAYDTCAVTDC